MRIRGFTLVELLIVIIIIGILATLLMPQMNQMAERARSAEARTMIGAIRTALVADRMERNPNEWHPNAIAGTLTTNTLINGALGFMIDNTGGALVGPSLFNYTVTAVASGNATITATRNGVNWTGGTTGGAVLTLVLNPTGGTVGGMTAAYNINPTGVNVN